MKHGPRLAFWLRLVLGTMLLSCSLPAIRPPVVLAAPARAHPSSPNAVNPPAVGWQDEMVDAPGLVGYGSSTALDSAGHPHIAYYNFTQHSLKYAAWDGVAWTLDTVDPQLGAIDTIPGSYPVRSGIAISGSMAYIVYQSFDEATQSSYLQFAQGAPGGWDLSRIVALPYAYAPTLKLDVNGGLHVSYSLSDLNDPWGLGPKWQAVVYTSREAMSTGWLTEGVDQLHKSGGVVTSLALDVNNQPQMAYGDPDSLDRAPVLFARLAGSAWLTQTLAANAYGPSLATDSAGNPHIAYADSTGIQYASWSGTAWVSESLNPGLTAQGLSLAFDGADHPSMAFVSTNPTIDFVYLELNTWDGVSWQNNFEPYSSIVSPALALDAAGNPHISYLDNAYQDLHHVTWGPAWITQTVAPAGDEVRLAVDLNSRPYISYSTNPTSTNPLIRNHVQLANWTPGGAWQYQEALPFSAKGQSMRLGYDLNQQPMPLFSYTDLTTAYPHLGFARLMGANLVTQTIDTGNDVGWSPSLSFDSQANPIIGYVDLNSGGPPHIKYAASSNNGQSWNVLTDTAAPPLGPYSGLLSLSTSGSIICCNIYTAYFDQASKALRLATWNGAQWTDERVDGGNGDQAGGLVSLAADQTTGKPAMAYYDATHSEIRYAIWRGAWVTTTVDSQVDGVSDLSLSLGQNSDQFPRIAYTASADNSVRLAWTYTPTATWRIDQVATLRAAPYATIPWTRLSSQVQERDRIAFSQPGMGVVYAFGAATLPYPIFYNALRPCLDSSDFHSPSAPTLARVRAMTPAALSQVDDLTTLRALRDLFALNPAGQHYISLYYQYAPETGALGLADPALSWDAYRTLQNFLPGFLALAAGQGDSIVITQAMVDQANNIADRLVAAGSPALGAAINGERDKYNHLQSFTGQTFAQAASLIGINAYRAYLPIVQR